MADVLYFRPEQGQFDVVQVSDYLARLGYSFRDPVKPDVFVVSASPEVRDHALKRRLEDPGRGFPYVLLISVEPGLITINQMTREKELELSRQFIEWLLDHYPCQVRDDYDHDLTEVCRRRSG
jgi:hypothetical protein